jgi:hypothetical protein
MVPARAVLFASVVAILPAAATAQRLSPQRLRPYEASIGAAPPAAAALFPRATDYRHEGLVVGAAVVGTGAAILAHALCGLDDSSHKNCTWLTIEAGVGGAVLGGLSGALVGGMMPKNAGAGSP